MAASDRTAGRWVVHPLTDEDAPRMEQRRRDSAPHKGHIDGPAARAPFDQLIGAIPAAAGVRFEEADVGGVRGWWCRPALPRSGSKLLFIHGGGYVLGSASGFRNFAAHFASRLSLDTFIPDYRLAPEHKFPAAINDVRACHDALAADGSAMLVVGDSAGGGLALALLSSLNSDGAVLPAAAAVMSPWTDLALAGASMHTRAEADPIFTRKALASLAGLYLGSADPSDPRASPLKADVADLPPIRIDVGDDEILLDDSLRYAAKAQAAGSPVELNIWMGMSHVFVSSLGELDAALAAIDAIASFLRSKLERSGSRDGGSGDPSGVREAQSEL